MPEETKVVDAELRNEGSIITLRPLTTTAKAWIDDYVQAEDWQWLGGALCIEPRYVGDIVGAMQADGLLVQL